MACVAYGSSAASCILAFGSASGSNVAADATGASVTTGASATTGALATMVSPLFHSRAISGAHTNQNNWHIAIFGNPLCQQAAAPIPKPLGSKVSRVPSSHARKKCPNQVQATRQCFAGVHEKLEPYLSTRRVVRSHHRAALKCHRRSEKLRVR